MSKISQVKSGPRCELRAICWGTILGYLPTPPWRNQIWLWKIFFPISSKPDSSCRSGDTPQSCSDTGPATDPLGHYAQKGCDIFRVLINQGTCKNERQQSRYLRNKPILQRPPSIFYRDVKSGRCDFIRRGTWMLADEVWDSSPDSEDTQYSWPWDPPKPSEQVLEIHRKAIIWTCLWVICPN